MDDAEAFVSGNAKLAKKELMLIFMLNLIPKTFFKMHYKKCHNKRRTSNLRHKMHWSEGIRLQTAAITNIGQVTLAVLSKTNLYEILRTCYFFAKHP